MIKKIDHFVITTNNFDECEKFYCKLGFTVKMTENRMELFSGDFKINVHLIGKELSPHATNVCIGSVDICFEIADDICEFANTLEKQGIINLFGIVKRHGVHGEMQSIYVNDTDGNLLEFCSYR